MVASDAITVGEDWISEHYLTSDAKGTFRAKVLERRKEWDATAKEGRETPRTRFLRVRQDLLRTFAGLAELTDADDGATAATATTAHSTTTAQPHEAPSEALRIALDALDATLLRALGYEAFGYEPHREGPVLRINSPGLTTGAPLAIISATTDPTGAKDPSTCSPARATRCAGRTSPRTARRSPPPPGCSRTCSWRRTAPPSPSCSRARSR